MRFRNVFLRILSSPSTGKRFFLSRVAILRFTLVITGIFDLLLGSIRNPEEVRSTFT